MSAPRVEDTRVVDTVTIRHWDVTFVGLDHPIAINVCEDEHDTFVDADGWLRVTYHTGDSEDVHLATAVHVKRWTSTMVKPTPSVSDNESLSANDIVERSANT